MTYERTLRAGVQYERAQKAALTTVPPMAVVISKDRVRRGGLALGYSVPVHLRDYLGRARSTTSLSRSILAAASDYVIGFGPLLAAALLPMPATARGAALIVAAVFVARAQRGFEVLMHEASHRNWTRRKRINDWISMLLAGAPILADLDTYRESHFRHHRLYGSSDDVDLQRYRDLALDELDRTSMLGYTLSMTRRMPKYWWSWYASAGLDVRALLRLGAWLSIVSVMTGLAGGAAPAILVVVTWIVSLTVVLPLIRFIGEAAEHVYAAGDTVFSTTVSNVGTLHRVLIHPHGDGFHTVHHLYQTIPHWMLGRVHETLMAADPSGYGAAVKMRRRVLQQVD